jgi:hypothetical protein
MAEWWEILLGGSIGGSVLTAGINKLLNRRKDGAEVDKTEIETLLHLQTATKTANETAAVARAEIEKARREGTGWYDAMIAAQKAMEAKVNEARAESKAEIDSLRRRNEQLTDTVVSMEAVIAQRTIDQGKVELAERQLERYDHLERAYPAAIRERDEARQERDEALAQVGQLRIEVQELRDEVAAQALVLKNNLNGGDAPHG